MARFDFSGYIEQRDEAIRLQEKAERDKQEQARLTWIDLKREAGNYIHRNGKQCEVGGEYPGVTFNAWGSNSLVVTVKNRTTFEIVYPGQRNAGHLETRDRTEEATSDRAVMQAIVEWYEGVRKGAV